MIRSLFQIHSLGWSLHRSARRIGSRRQLQHSGLSGGPLKGKSPSLHLILRQVRV